MEKEILEAFNIWIDALKSKDAKKVASLYDKKDAILIPTVSSKVRHNQEEIEDYFKYFLKKNPIGKIDEANIRIFGNIAINSGLYTFSLDDENKNRVNVKARFTFVYKKVDNNWVIIEHHSSVLP
jgi:uncharacterized protein (TIGR02246 family)